MDNSEIFTPDKPFKTYEQQIEILQERGLLIDDFQFAKHMLQTYSYYDLVNGNLDELMTSRHPDKFIDGTSMNLLVLIKILEDRTKNIFLKQILMIEKTFKSTLSYYVSENFGVNNNEGGYLSRNYYNYENIPKVVKATLKNLKKICKGNVKKSQGLPIKHYQKDHNHIPPWILSDELMFGEVFYWFKILKLDSKKIISNEMVNFPISLSSDEEVELFTESIDILREFRNFFAHNSVLSHMKSKRQLNLTYIGDFSDSESILYNLKNDPNNKNNLLACFLCILLLSKDSDQLNIFLADINATIQLVDEDTAKLIFEDIFHLPLQLIERGETFTSKL